MLHGKHGLKGLDVATVKIIELSENPVGLNTWIVGGNEVIYWQLNGLRREVLRMIMWAEREGQGDFKGLKKAITEMELYDGFK